VIHNLNGSITSSSPVPDATSKYAGEVKAISQVEVTLSGDPSGKPDLCETYTSAVMSLIFLYKKYI